VTGYSILIFFEIILFHPYPDKFHHRKESACKLCRSSRTHPLDPPLDWVAERGKPELREGMGCVHEITRRNSVQSKVRRGNQSQKAAMEIFIPGCGPTHECIFIPLEIWQSR